MDYTYEYFQKSADYVKKIVPWTPDVAIVLGSCLGPFADTIEDPIVIDYKDIPNFLVSTVKSHAGKLIFGTVAGKRVVCMSGRFHSYEGYDFEQLVIPVRLFKLLGVKATILTNAAGAINPSYRPGDVMIVSDHIKFTGASPLRGHNVEEFGPRFFDVSRMYTPELRKLAWDCAADSGLNVHEGVYFFFTGPQFETPAEIRAARLLGGDAAGMSTVTEALTAAHCGMPLLCLSVMTNMAAGVLDQPITSEEVDDVGKMIAGRFSAYIAQDRFAHRGGDRMRRLFAHAGILAWRENRFHYIPDGYLGVDGDAIDYVGAEKPAQPYDETRDMSGRLLMPGLVDAHCHSAMTLLRGVGSDLPLDKWLFEKMMPVEDR